MGKPAPIAVWFSGIKHQVYLFVQCQSANRLRARLIRRMFFPPLVVMIELGASMAASLMSLPVAVWIVWESTMRTIVASTPGAVRQAGGAFSTAVPGSEEVKTRAADKTARHTEKVISRGESM